MSAPEVPTMAKAEINAFYGSLDDAQRSAVEKSDSLLEAIEKTDADATFKRGDALRSVQEAVGDGGFTTWCGLKWPYDRSYAYAFIRVSERLGQFRQRLVSAAVDRASLMDLANRPQHAESVLACFEAGRRLTNAQVKELLRDGPAPEGQDEPGEKGGLAGLQKLYAEKKKRLRDLTARFSRIAFAVETALAAPRVVKTELAQAVVQEARWARAELQNLCAFIMPSPWDALKPAPVPFPEDSGWHAVDRMLYRLGGTDDWPVRHGMEEWLRETVLPPLRWAAGEATDGETPPSDRPPDDENKVTAPTGTASRPEAGGPVGHSLPPVEAAHPFMPSDVEASAALLALLRSYYLTHGVASADVEDTCRRSAEALTVPIAAFQPTDLNEGGARALAAKVAHAIYERSLAAEPVVPVSKLAPPANAASTGREGHGPG